MSIRPLDTWWLVLVMSVAVSAHESKQAALVKTDTAALNPGHQSVGTATYPPEIVLQTGGYKRLDGTITTRALVGGQKQDAVPIRAERHVKDFRVFRNGCFCG